MLLENIYMERKEVWNTLYASTQRIVTFWNASERRTQVLPHGGAIVGKSVFFYGQFSLSARKPSSWSDTENNLAEMFTGNWGYACTTATCASIVLAYLRRRCFSPTAGVSVSVWWAVPGLVFVCVCVFNRIRSSWRSCRPSPHTGHWVQLHHSARTDRDTDPLQRDR